MRYYYFLCLVVLVSCASSIQKVSTVPPQNEVIEKVGDFFPAFQLGTPVLKIERTLFKEKTVATLALRLPEVTIRYTLDGSEPTQSSQPYGSPITLTKSGQLKAKAFHANYQSSETVAATFRNISDALLVESVAIDVPPHQNYTGSGDQTLIDQIKGERNFRTPRWMGFQKTVTATLKLSQAKTANQLTVSTLSDTDSWIFPPASIAIYAVNESGKEQLLAEKSIETPTKDSSPMLQFHTLRFTPQTLSVVKVVVKNYAEIPEWHAGKGTPSWLFLDEMLVENR
ncbi:MAG: chitobiase/beta-hexosaminidase C-terminal domain-containing protein [Bacteroidota bacterium]